MNVKLSDVAEFINGGAWSDREYVDYGIPVIKVTNLKNDSVDLSDVSHIPETSLYKYHKHLLYKGDLVIATVGSHPNLVTSAAGRATIIPSKAEGALLNQNALCIRTRSSKLEQGYLGYLGKSSTFQNYIQSLGRGAANQVRIALGLIKEFSFELPPLPMQRRIASILSAYDDLIEVNMKRIKLLEEQAFLRYKQIVRDEKALKTISVLDYAEIMNGGTPNTSNPNFWDGDIPFFTPKDLSNELGFYVNDTERKVTELGLDKCNSKLYPRNTIFITARGTVGKLALAKIPTAMSQSSYALQTKYGSKNFYLFLALKDKIAHFKQVAVGGVFDTIIMNTFKMIHIDLPGKDVTDSFNESIEPVFKLMDTLQKQNAKLREARDILLPRLMSGVVGV